MKRRFDEHIITPNKSCALPRRFVFYDTESYLVETDKNITALPFRLGYYAYCVRVNEYDIHVKESGPFYSAKQFVDLLTRLSLRKTRIYVIAHNAQHDIACMSLLPLLQDSGFTLETLYVKAGTLVIRAYYKNTSYIFLSSTNYFRQPLETLADMLHLKKYEVDFKTCTDNELLQHCKVDVEILIEVMKFYLQFIVKNKLGKFGYSAAGQALNSFRHRFMGKRIQVHNNQTVKKLERSAYGGGCVRCYRIGYFENGPFYKLDINSMYPYIMRTYELPYRFHRIFTSISVDDLKRLLKFYSVIADCTVAPIRPYYRKRTKESVVYPLYPFRSVFCTPELMSLVANDEIVEIHICATYRKAILFNEYVDFFYALRQHYRETGNLIMSHFCKVLLNALYGKFAARNESLVFCPEANASPFPVRYVVLPGEKTPRFVYYIGKEPYVLKENGDAYNSFVPISAEITAYGRMLIQSYVDIAGVENVFYCDTDSIICNEEGYTHLIPFISNTELGKLKLEGISSSLEVNARKDYVFNNTRVLKGIPYSAKTIDTNVYCCEMWSTLTATLGKGRDKPYGIRYVTKVLKRKIYDGLPSLDGFIVPFTCPPPYDPNPFADPLA